jgi:hypothetical protein
MPAGDGPAEDDGWWERSWRSTDPVDRGAAEEAVHDFYRKIGWLGPLKQILWCNSPVQFGLTARGFVRAFAANAEILSRYDAKLGGRPSNVDPRGFDRLFRDAMGGSDVTGTLWRYHSTPEPEDGVEYYKAEGDADEEDDGLERTDFTVRLPDLVQTQFLSHNAKGIEDSVRQGAIRYAPRIAMARVMRHAGAFLPLFGTAILCERPTHLAADEQGRPHSITGPALRYSSGWEAFAFHGVPVAEDVFRRLRDGPPFTQREILKTAEIDFQNALVDDYGLAKFADEIDGYWLMGLEANPALRRRLVEAIGIQRAARKAYPVQILRVTDRDLRRKLIEAYGVPDFVMRCPTARRTDDYGTLHAVEVPGDEALVIVEVLNSTPEPDGTFQNYFLRVPPTVLTPREAVAWTFGLEDLRDYAPVHQT